MTDNTFVSQYLMSVGLDLDDNHQLKQVHDEYDVYVNEDYVGKKILLTQNDTLQDIDHFLKQNGFGEFTADLTGDHYRIMPTNMAESNEMKEQLSIYLQIR
ncbi:hypothetical protein [Ammoniphilus sp. CFH 90114]|uniref:hypothetical protein n=1 Tax=Ammoniphilus sp. CFH 90114 TaxID=2493665 RepID=UPI00100DDAE8|nr:hypothetical protein [Ammoniphilus sp. CFH 90114]RXT15254.1 hypothetical protein EIZ39_03315 [Ammoniphilus sp. CFH 90114]